MFLQSEDFDDFVASRLAPNSPAFQCLEARHFLCTGEPPVTFLAVQLRTRKRYVFEGPALHMFVPTLRCDHRCLYCQVSPRRPHERGYDMSVETAAHAVDRVFESSAPALTIELQGGEAALRWDLVHYIVELAERRNDAVGKPLRFVLTTTLHLLTDNMLRYCRDHRIDLSTSLDGPAFIHDAQRPNPSRDGFDRTTRAIARARDVVGPDRVSALTTITRHSLRFPHEIVDCYVEHGFSAISLRPLSPYGFAVRGWNKLGYTPQEFLRFYREAFDYILAINQSGTYLEEETARMLLAHVLTPFPTGYVDLRSPTGAGFGALIYNYDGKVYAADEGRMLAEMGDERFCLGDVRQSLFELLRSPAMQWIAATGLAEALPGCADCAFVPYCGADPVFHTATADDPVGHRPTSAFCRRQTGLFHLLFEYLHAAEPRVMRTFMAWLARRHPTSVAHAGAWEEQCCRSTPMQRSAA
jgi:His-Xaa-Ser system radical SAM maturase HxsB